MSKKIKLGDKANSFYDPTSKLKVLPEQVITLKKIHTSSNRITKALRDGHLQYTDAEPTVEPENDEPENTADEDKNWIAELELEPGKLKKLNKSDLIEVALYFESSLSAEELQEMSKSEIIEEIFELQDVDE